MSMTMLSAAAVAGELDVTDMAPVVVTVRVPMPQYPLEIYGVDAADSIGGSLVDGWHRLFGARLFGVTSIPGLVIREEPGGET
jgi:hypothetical protein